MTGVLSAGRAHNDPLVGALWAYTQRMPVGPMPLDPPRLRQARLRAALSQRALAQKSGVGESTLRAIELGQRPARPSTISKLASALGIQPQDLMSDD